MALPLLNPGDALAVRSDSQIHFNAWRFAVRVGIFKQFTLAVQRPVYTLKLPDYVAVGIRSQMKVDIPP